MLHSYSNAAHKEMIILIKCSIWKQGIMTTNCFKVCVPPHVSGHLPSPPPPPPLDLAASSVNVYLQDPTVFSSFSLQLQLLFVV